MKIEGVVCRVDTGMVKPEPGALQCLYRIEVAGRYYFCDPAEFVGARTQLAQLSPGLHVRGMAWRTRNHDRIGWLMGDGFELAPRNGWRQGLWAMLFFAVSLGLIWPLCYLILVGGDNVLSRTGGLLYTLLLLLCALIAPLGVVGLILAPIRIVTAFRPSSLRAMSSYQQASRNAGAAKA